MKPEERTTYSSSTLELIRQQGGIFPSYLLLRNRANGSSRILAWKRKTASKKAGGESSYFSISFLPLCVHVYSVASICDSLHRPPSGSLPMGFSRQEYWSGLPGSPPRDLPHPRSLSASLGLAGGFFTTSATWEALFCLSASLFSRVRLFATLWTVARQAPLSMGRRTSSCLLSPGKNTGMGCHSLLQGISPIQGSNQRLLWLLHFKRILYPLSHLKRPLPSPSPASRLTTRLILSSFYSFISFEK